MDCPACNHPDHIVTDSREKNDGTIRRRRKCLGCNHRWTTLERGRDDDVPWTVREMEIKFDRQQELVVLRVGFVTVGMSVDDVNYWTSTMIACQEELHDYLLRKGKKA